MPLPDRLHLGPGVQVTLNPVTTWGDSATSTDIVPGGLQPTMINCWAYANATAHQILGSSFIPHGLPPAQEVRVVAREDGQIMVVRRYGFTRPDWRPVFDFSPTTIARTWYNQPGTTKPLPDGPRRLATRGWAFRFYVYDRPTLNNMLGAWLPVYTDSINANSFTLVDFTFPATYLRFDGLHGRLMRWGGANDYRASFGFTYDPYRWREEMTTAGFAGTQDTDWQYMGNLFPFPALP